MKQHITLIILCLSIFISTQAQNVEVYNYKFVAQYDANGNRVNSNSTGLLVTITYWTDFYGRTTCSLFGSESNTIAGQVMPAMPLCPINQQLSYTGTNNGWRVFNWMNTVLVLISSDTNTARVERHANGRFLYYTEYRK